jgi:hypothetical protein
MEITGPITAAARLRRFPGANFAVRLETPGGSLRVIPECFAGSAPRFEEAGDGGLRLRPEGARRPVRLWAAAEDETGGAFGGAEPLADGAFRFAPLTARGWGRAVIRVLAEGDDRTVAHFGHFQRLPDGEWETVFPWERPTSGGRLAGGQLQLEGDGREPARRFTIPGPASGAKLSGYVDSIAESDRDRIFTGWAADPGGAADGVALFDSDRLLVLGPTGGRRPDVADYLGQPDAAWGGFVIRARLAAGTPARLFGIWWDGRAIEIPLPGARA